MIHFQCFAVYCKIIGPDRYIVNNVICFGGKYIYKDDKEPTKYNAMCEKMIYNLIQDVIFIVNAILFSYATFLSGTLYAFFYKKTSVTLLGTELPFLDNDSLVVYGINMVIQLIVAGVGILATVGIEVGACMAYNTVETIPELIQLESAELLEELQSNGMSLVAKMRVRNVFMQLQDLDG